MFGRTKITVERLLAAARGAADGAMRRIESEVGAPCCIQLECEIHLPESPSGLATMTITAKTELAVSWKASMGHRVKKLKVAARCDKILYGHALTLPKEWDRWLTLAACQHACSKLGALPWMLENCDGSASFLSLAFPQQIPEPPREIITYERGSRQEYIMCAPSAEQHLWYCHPGSSKGDAVNINEPFLPGDLTLIDLRREWDVTSRPKKRLRGRVRRRGQVTAAATAKPYAYGHILSVAKWMAIAGRCEDLSLPEVARECGLLIDPWEWESSSDPQVVILWTVERDDNVKLYYSAREVKLLLADLLHAFASVKLAGGVPTP